MDGVEVSTRLRDLRKSYHIEHNMEKQLSTKKLAEMLNEKCKEKGIKGITEQTLKDYERPGLQNTTENITKGKAVYGMRVEYLDLLADFYGVSTDYLLGRSPYKTPDVDLQSACAFTGLSEPSATFLHKENRHNPMYWRMDMINFLLEHETFPQLLNFLVGYATATGSRLHDVPGTNGIAPIVTDKDIFKAKINDLVNLIVFDTPNLFKSRPDYRVYYKSYFGAYLDERFEELGYTLDDVKKEMEANGLIFNAEMFMEKEDSDNGKH